MYPVNYSVQDLKNRLEVADAEIQRKDEALRFYADESNYRNGVPGHWKVKPEAISDNGAIARKALQPKED